MKKDIDVFAVSSSLLFINKKKKKNLYCETGVIVACMLKLT